MTRSTRPERAAARANWPIRQIPLDREGDNEPEAASSPEQRLAMVWRLTQDAWVMSGRTFPDYPRAQTPGRLRRVDEDETDGSRSQ